MPKNNPSRILDYYIIMAIYPSDQLTKRDVCPSND